MGVVIRRSIFVAVAALAAFAVSCEGEGHRAQVSAARPNIVLVVLDTVRRDASVAVATGDSKAGGGSVTPQLDALAARGTRFVNAWTVAPWTVPAHASLFTGLLPSAHGSGSRNWRLASHLPTLAQLLSRDGYETAAFFSNPWLSDRATGMLRGFELRREVPIGGLGELRSIRGDQGGRATLENIQRWAQERRDDRPFFLFVNFLEAHLSYDPPREIRRRYLEDLPADEKRSIQWASRVNARALPPEQVDWEVTRRLYYADVRFADQLLGELISRLRGLGLLENTVLIVTSDHGENLGEHGLVEHQFSLHETVLAVPLVIVAPPVLLASGVRSDPVMIVDLFPTIAELGGLHLERAPDYSHSLLAPPGEKAAQRAVVAEFDSPSGSLLRVLRKENPKLDLTPFRRGYESIRVGSERLTVGSDGWSAFHDLASDPLQQHDLGVEKGERAAQLGRVLRDLLGSPRTRRAGEERPEERLDPETRERLRSLGYIE